MTQELKKILTIEEIDWSAQEHNILCMEHVLHLAAKYFVEAIALPLSTKISKKVQAALKKSSHNSDLDLDELDHELAETNLEDPEEDTESDTSDNEDFNTFLPGDLLGKALALVKQIHASPQACTFFRSTCSQVGIDPLELLLWVHMHWASLYTFLERLFKQKLMRVKRFQIYLLLKRDWECLDIIWEVLCDPSVVQQSFSGVHHPTVWKIIPSLEYIIKCWEMMLKNLKFVDLRIHFKKGFKILRNGIIELMTHLQHIQSVSYLIQKLRMFISRYTEQLKSSRQ
ncbi:hypothetical protein BDQ17DRAFT_1335785 [Cyathus striatus]|nr:hypothetical protein BDQ17DRAFT_1335785 [Cyathus striatus]